MSNNRNLGTLANRLDEGSTGDVLTKQADGSAQFAAASGGPNIQTFTSSGTWNKPSSGTLCIIHLIGGGGGGGRLTSGFGGNGAPATGTYKAILMSNMPSSASVTIGAGGSGSTNDQVVGGTGGKTSIGTIFTSVGAAGGVSYNGTTIVYPTTPSLTSTEKANNSLNLIYGGEEGAGGSGGNGGSSVSNGSVGLYGTGGNGDGGNATGLASGGAGGLSAGGAGSSGFLSIVVL